MPIDPLQIVLRDTRNRRLYQDTIKWSVVTLAKQKRAYLIRDTPAFLHTTRLE